jgi:hypothetical protein
MIVIRLQKIGNATELAIDDMETDGDIDSERPPETVLSPDNGKS